MKKILFVSCIIGITLIIYQCFKDNKILYVNIEDDIGYQTSYEKGISSYLKKKNRYEDYVEYTKKNYRITDFVNDIKENVFYNENKTIKNLLIKADIITVWIGTNDIYYKIKEDDEYELYQYIDDILIDMEEFLSLMRKNSKEQIIVIGIRNQEGKDKQKYFDYYNQKIEELCEKYHIDFIKKVDGNVDKDKRLERQIIKMLKMK